MITGDGDVYLGRDSRTVGNHAVDTETNNSSIAVLLLDIDSREEGEWTNKTKEQEKALEDLKSSLKNTYKEIAFE